MRKRNRHLFAITLISALLVVSFLWITGLTLAQDDEAVETFLPAPTGPYQVGRTARHWVDEAREEIFTDDPDDQRELVVRIWYPADGDANAAPAPYVEDFTGATGEDAIRAWLSFLNPDAPIVTWLVERMGQWAAHAIADAPIADTQTNYPVLIFSPGFRSLPEQYTAQIEELASHGYVVVGISHTYISGVSVFPEGTIVPAHNFDFRSPQQFERVLNTSAQDILFVIDQVELLNADDATGQFNGRLDLEHIGVFGHSLGGGAAVLAGANDDRIQTLVIEDGAQILSRDYDSERLTEPMMVFTSGDIDVEYVTVGPYYEVTADSFNHQSFADDPVWPLPPELPPMGNERTVTIVRAYVLAFFDHYLTGAAVPLLDGASDDYPEIQIEISNTE